MWRDAEPVARAPDPPPQPRATSGDVVLGVRCASCGVRKIYLGEGTGYLDSSYRRRHDRQCVGRAA